MPVTDWFPSKVGSIRSWYQNFKLHAADIAVELKIDASPALAGATKWLDFDDKAEQARTAYAGASKAAQEQGKPSEAGARAFIKLLKATPGVTPEMIAKLLAQGADTDPQTRADAQRPELKLAVEGGQVVISFTKHGHQGILLYAKRGDDTEWTLLGLDTYSPYVDTRPNRVPGQPEDRQYRAYYADRDHAVGELSDVATIAVRG